MPKIYIRIIFEGNGSFDRSISGPLHIPVDDVIEYIRKDIKSLSFYDKAQLIPYEADGITEISINTLLKDLKLNKLISLIIKATKELNRFSKEELIGIGYDAETSIQNYFDVIARRLSSIYTFDWEIKNFPKFSDIINAYDMNQWKFNYESKFKGTLVGVPIVNTPLPDLFSKKEWETIKRIYKNHGKRAAFQILKNVGVPTVILPHSDYNDDTISMIKDIYNRAGFDKIGFNKKLVVKDELQIFKNAACKSVYQ